MFNCCVPAQVNKMNLPDNTELPFFAYGLFKRDELAYNQISKFVEGQPLKVVIRGSLRVRDGLPLLNLGGRGEVHGYLIKFRQIDSDKAYQKICQFEPEKYYRWKEYKFPDKVMANVLIGLDINKGSDNYDYDEWHGKEDPVFKYSISIINKTVKNFASKEFVSAPPDDFDWERFFKLQMAYLLLWAAIERYCSFAFGPVTNPSKKIMSLANDKVFKDTLKEKLDRNETIYDTRNLKKYTLDKNDSEGSLKYYYQLRNNLSHRGKAAFRDGEIVRLSLCELVDIFRIVLDKRVFHRRYRNQL